MMVTNAAHEDVVIDNDMATHIHFELTVNGYVDRHGALTDKYYTDKQNDLLVLSEELAEYKGAIVGILDTIYNPKVLQPENARSNNVELTFDEDKFNKKEFQALWKSINSKTAYVVDFETDELIRKAIYKINTHLQVVQVFFTVATGVLDSISSKESLEKGEAFKTAKTKNERARGMTNVQVKYDLIGKLVEETGLTRKAIVQILSGIQPDKFAQFKQNPEDFIIKTARLINEEKATAIIQHIHYNKLEDSFGTDIFTEPGIKGKLGVNAIAAQKHLYDYVIYDSAGVEKNFAQALDAAEEVSVYVKLPKGFYISTPVGKYNPDWAIAFNKDLVKHVYFVAETKGSMQTLDLREIENAKIQCAREHFKAISTEAVRYDVVNSYGELMNLVK